MTKCPHLDPHITALECTTFYVSLGSASRSSGNLHRTSADDGLKYYHGCSFELASSDQSFTYNSDMHNPYGGTRDDLSEGGAFGGFVLVCRKQVVCP